MKRYLTFIFLSLLISNFSISTANIRYLQLKELQNGEELKYKFSFFIFRKAAIVKLYIHKIDNNLYEGVLKGHTCGVVGLFTAFRKDTYISLMKYDNITKRFIPLKFVRKTQINKKVRESTYIFDYLNKTITKVKRKYINGKKVSEHVFKIKFYPPIEDYITGIYNFRMGVYGFPKKNSPVKVKIFPERKRKNRIIKISLLKKKKNLFFLKANIFKDIVKTKNNEITGYINNEMVPVEGFLPGVPIFGNIKAELLFRKLNGKKVKFK